MTQNYLFAHRILPQLVFSDPAAARAHLGELKFLRRLWAHAGMHATEGETTPVCETLAVSAEGNRTLIVLPPPEQPPEAHFVAVVWNDPPELLVLELGDSWEGEPSNYLCGWDAQGVHHNYGDGHPADLSSFRDAVAAR